MTKDFSSLVTREWNFGNDKDVADSLRKLVLSGKKTATTGLFKEGKQLSLPGDYAAILDSDGKRFCIVQYTKVQVKSFLEVDYDYAVLEGEGDKNLDEWREKHRQFFISNYGEFMNTAQVACEEFKVVQLLDVSEI